MAWVVTAAAVVANIGGADRYLYRGAVLPDGVENLEHLSSAGLVAEVKPAAEAKPARTAGSK